ALSYSDIGVVRLYIINGGRPAFIRLVFAKNLSKGNNADVPNRFYLRVTRSGGPRSQTSPGHPRLGRSPATPGLHPLRLQSGADQGHPAAHAQTHPSG